MSVQQDSLIGRGLLGEDRLVDVGGGRRLRAMVAGDGDDLVVLEAGLGMSGLYWSQVHQAISWSARVVAYERAGFGASTPDSAHPRNLTRLADDLQAVIDAIPHRRLVLVGHSWGGPIVRTAAAARLAQGAPVDGIVLVDQSDEHAADLYGSRTVRASGALQRALMVPLARLRLLAPLTRTQVSGLPEPLLAAVVASSSSVDAARAAAAELAHVADDLQRLRDDPLDLGEVGISVISGQQQNRLDRRIRTRLIQAHRDTAAEHPGARFIAAEHSGHMIPVTEPDLIASEALSLLGTS
ncbi:MAG: alpha/beta hydrolase [Propionibacteriaceae bacterium]|nr:alpha/beta hydrolase [Propionibacteriaceae bacterium]